MNGGGGGGMDPVATATQLHRLNAAVALLQMGINDINFGVAMIQALNDANHVNRLAFIHNSLGQINGSLNHIGTILGDVEVHHHHLVLILGHAELISGSISGIHSQIVQFGLEDLALCMSLGPTLAGRLHIHTGFGFVLGALAAVIEIIHPPVAPQAPGLPNGGVNQV